MHSTDKGEQSGCRRQLAEVLGCLQVQTRLTVSGQQCHLPMVYEGQLLTDCLATPQGEQCFPIGSSTLQNCSDASHSSRSLAALLLMGDDASLDGRHLIHALVPHSLHAALCMGLTQPGGRCNCLLAAHILCQNDLACL